MSASDSASLEVSRAIGGDGLQVDGWIPSAMLLGLICDHMDEGLDMPEPVEVGGLLCFIPNEGLSYVAGENTSKNPTKSIQFKGQWVSELVVYRAYTPIALVHSHPGGQIAPSPRDMELFPSWLVPQGIIVQPRSKHSGAVTVYDARNWQRKPWSEVFLATPQ